MKVGVADLNSGPQKHTTSTLSTEPSHEPHPLEKDFANSGHLSVDLPVCLVCEILTAHLGACTTVGWDDFGLNCNTSPAALALDIL